MCKAVYREGDPICPQCDAPSDSKMIDELRAEKSNFTAPGLCKFCGCLFAVVKSDNKIEYRPSTEQDKQYWMTINLPLFELVINTQVQILQRRLIARVSQN